MVADVRQTLPVMEMYSTLQGEGFFTGYAAYFIRLAGCKIGCHWCDVKESWDEKKHPEVLIEEICQKATESRSQRVVITGGEPLQYNLDVLSTALRTRGLRTHLETSGAYPLTGTWDWITLSPKRRLPPTAEILQAAHELKTVIYNQADFAWAATYAAQVRSICHLFLQPEWSKQDTILPLIIDYLKSHPRWRLSLQTHKFVGLP